MSANQFVTLHFILFFFSQLQSLAHKLQIEAHLLYMLLITSVNSATVIINFALKVPKWSVQGFNYSLLSRSYCKYTSPVHNDRAPLTKTQTVNKMIIIILKCILIIVKKKKKKRQKNKCKFSHLWVKLLFSARVTILAAVPTVALGGLSPFVPMFHIRTRS